MSSEYSNEPIVAQVVQPILQENWEAIQKKREAIFEVVEQISASFPSAGKKRLRALSSWFSQPRSFESALVRSDVLAVCVPLCRSLEVDGDLSESDIGTAVRVGFCSIGENASGGRQLLKALIYPGIVLLGAAMVAIFFSVYVIPEFEKMFTEFGIELPATTHFVFDMAKSVRTWCWIFLVWLASAFGTVWYLNKISARRRPDGLSWLDLWMQSSRTALADWAWHISLLLESGLPQNAAMKRACRFAGKSWLREGSHFWTAGKSQTTDEAARQSEPATLQYLTNAKYQLLDHALSVPNSEGKIRLLREVAMYYRDRNRNVGLWWIEWLVAILLWGIGFIILLCIISLFAPFMAIITGLTSNV